MAKKKQDFCLIPKKECELDENGLYQLLEPTDFKEYLKIVTKLPQDPWENAELHEEYTLRHMLEFVQAIDEYQIPDRKVMMWLAWCFKQVIYMERWENAFSLPWTQRSYPGTVAQYRQFEAYLEVDWVINANRRNGVTESKLKIMKDVAAKLNMSYESVRAAYYECKSSINK